MKKIITIALLLAISTSFAQQDLINYLFEIRYNYKTFNLKGKVKQLEYETGMTGGAMGLLSNKNYRCLFNKKGNLTYVTSFKSVYSDNNKNHENYKYDINNNLNEINIVENNKPIKNYYFFYNKKEQLKSVMVTDVKTQIATDYSIEWKNNQPTRITIKMNNKQVIYLSYNHQFDKNNNIIKYDFNEAGDSGKVVRKYDDKNNLVFEKYEYFNDSTYNFEVKTTFDKDNNITSKTEDGKTIKYFYVPEANKNWKILKNGNYIEFREYIYY